MLDADSVAGLIHTSDGHYLLQHRDDVPHVTFPGMWGLFGGARDAGETAGEALSRELAEELALRVEPTRPFLTSTFETRLPQRVMSRRTYFEVAIERQSLANLVLSEGQGMKLLSVRQIGAIAEVVIPFDMCAILMHAAHVARESVS